MKSAPVSVLVHAAAIGGIHGLAETGRLTFDGLIGVNLGGPFFLTQALAPRLAEGLVSCSSAVCRHGTVSARHGRDRHAAYSASKAALLGLTTSLAAELGPRVRVLCFTRRDGYADVRPGSPRLFRRAGFEHA